MNLCVYGASSQAIEERYLDAGKALGAAMARKGYGLIFGGGDTGLMGAVVRGVMEKGGYSIGIAPTFFDKPGILYQQCSEMIFTETMRQRKELMEQKADGFIMTPGGIGTLEEFFEILTLKQLGRHGKPIGILNTGGYYDKLLDLLEAVVAQGFMEESGLSLFVCDRDPQALLEKMAALW